MGFGWGWGLGGFGCGQVMIGGVGGGGWGSCTQAMPQAIFKLLAGKAVEFGVFVRLRLIKRFGPIASPL